MAEKRNNLWFVLIAAVPALGCLALVGLMAVGMGVGFWSVAEEDLPPEAAAPVVVESPEPPACPTEPSHEIRYYVQLTATAFQIRGTDGTAHDLPYQGSAYPYSRLRERLERRRQIEPDRTEAIITTESGVDAEVHAQVLTIAREAGYSDAFVCRQLNPLQRLEQGEPAEQPGFEALNLPLGQEGTAAGDSAEPSTGYGGSGGGLSGRTRIVARVRTGESDVRGSLSREVIRRVIRRHINEIRFCYEQELVRQPELEGEVTVSFIIAPSGVVQSAAVGRSTLGNATVESCITQAVRRWTFPAPEGDGIVGVNYPFVLSASR